MEVNIYQGIQDNLPYADINIVIDVIRAFSVSYYAFKSNVEKIYLVDSIENALKIKNKDKDRYVLSGEIKGYKIDEFDLGNSPYDMLNIDLTNKILVQKTTNGVKVALSALNAKYIFVTGFINYKSLIYEIKQLEDIRSINIIASHPDGDDDLACAELLQEMIYAERDQIKRMEENAIYRILNAQASKKFLDMNNKDFLVSDLILCATLSYDKFIMQIDKNSEIPSIIKKEI